MKDFDTCYVHIIKNLQEAISTRKTNTIYTGEIFALHETGNLMIFMRARGVQTTVCLEGRHVG